MGVEDDLLTLKKWSFPLRAQYKKGTLNLMMYETLLAWVMIDGRRTSCLGNNRNSFYTQPSYEPKNMVRLFSGSLQSRKSID